MNEHFQAKRLDPQTTNLSVKRKVLSVGCSEKKKVEKDSKTKAGIQTLKSDTKYYSGLMIDETDLLRDYVHKAIEGAAQGISLFSLNALSNEHLKILTHVLKEY